MSFYLALGSLGIQNLGVPAAKGDWLWLESHFIRPSKLLVDKAPKFFLILLFNLLQLQQPNRSF